MQDKKARVFSSSDLRKVSNLDGPGDSQTGAIRVNRFAEKPLFKAFFAERGLVFRGKWGLGGPPPPPPAPLSPGGRWWVFTENPRGGGLSRERGGGEGQRCVRGILFFWGGGRGRRGPIYHENEPRFRRKTPYFHSTCKRFKICESPQICDLQFLASPPSAISQKRGSVGRREKTPTPKTRFSIWT